MGHDLEDLVPHLLLQTQTDERLADLSARGHAAAFTVLVERHRRSLYRVTLNLVSVGEADDVMQQSLLQAWAALQNGAQIGHVRGWLHHIVRHVAIRSRAAPVPYEALGEEATAAVSLQPDPDAVLRMRETLAGVAELPAKQRMALLRCAVQGESQASVATELGTTETGVRQLLYRARTSLRAAATAILPFPLAQWAASAGLGAGGGFALGAGAKLATAVVFVAVGSGAGLVVDSQHEDTRQRATPRAAAQPAVTPSKATATRAVSAASAVSPTASATTPSRRAVTSEERSATNRTERSDSTAAEPSRSDAKTPSKAQTPESHQRDAPSAQPAQTQPASPQPPKTSPSGGAGGFAHDLRTERGART